MRISAAARLHARRRPRPKNVRRSFSHLEFLCRLFVHWLLTSVWRRRTEVSGRHTMCARVTVTLAARRNGSRPIVAIVAGRPLAFAFAFALAAATAAAASRLPVNGRPNAHRLRASAAPNHLRGPLPFVWLRSESIQIASIHRSHFARFSLNARRPIEFVRFDLLGARQLRESV